MAIQYLIFGRKEMEGLSCTHLAITTDVPLQLWEAITTDGESNTPIWLTRTLHNKPLFFILNYLRCYFHYLSPHFLNQMLGSQFTIILIIALYLIWKRHLRIWRIMKWVIFLYPTFFIFELQNYFN
jgi:hypothetical protein